MTDRFDDVWRRYIDTRIAAADARIGELQAERRVLLGMRDQPPPLSFNGDAPPNAGSSIEGMSAASRAVPSTESERRNPNGPTPTDGVDALVARVPGLTRVEIVDRLENEVASDAENVRATISSAVGRRIKHGQFVQDHLKRVWPKDHEKAQEVLRQRDQKELNAM